jgi:nicotinamidase-related amidase
MSFGENIPIRFSRWQRSKTGWDKLTVHQPGWTACRFLASEVVGFHNFIQKSNPTMKKLSILALCLLFGLSANLYSQDKKDPSAKIKPALVVIDIQNAFLPGIPEADRKMGLDYINYLIDLFHSADFPVIRVYHSSKAYGVTQGTEGFDFPKTVKIDANDPMVVKTYPDGFNKTDLNDVIRRTGSNTLFLCGLSAVGCVLATYMGAQNNDFTAFMVKNAIMSHNTEYTRKIEEIFDAVPFEAVQSIVKASKE